MPTWNDGMALAERLPTPLRETPVSRASRGRATDGAAFADLVERYDRTVYNVALSMVHNSQDAEDIAQEVWIKVANNLANLRDQNLFLPWLYRISRNCSLTFLSAQKNRRLVTNTDDDDQATNLPSPAADNPEVRAISDDERREVWAALNALSESDRKILLLREFQELPYEQIAGILGISRGNAEVRVFRARMRFRQQFSRREGTLARGFLGLPLLGLIAKLRLAFGFSATSASTGGAAAGTGAAAGGAAAGTAATGAAAATSTGIAAQVGAGIAAKIAISAASLSLAAGAVAIAAPEVAPIIEAPIAALVQPTHDAPSAQLSVARTAPAPGQAAQPETRPASSAQSSTSTQTSQPVPAGGPAMATGGQGTDTTSAARVPAAAPAVTVFTNPVLPGEDFVYVTLPAPGTLTPNPTGSAGTGTATNAAATGVATDDGKKPAITSDRGGGDNKPTTAVGNKSDDASEPTGNANSHDGGARPTTSSKSDDANKPTGNGGGKSDDVDRPTSGGGNKPTSNTNSKNDDAKKPAANTGNKGDNGNKATSSHDSQSNGKNSDDGRKPGRH